MARPTDCASLLFLVLAFTGLEAKIFVNIVKDGDKTELGGLWCHEEVMRNYTEQVLKLQANQVLLYQKLDQFTEALTAKLALYERRFEQEMGLHRNALLEIKTLSSLRPRRMVALPATSCAEAVPPGGNQSGVYQLEIGDIGATSVYCIDLPGDRDWLVVQQRLDGGVDFDRDWQSYKDGFGTPEGDHFIGLKRLHALTSAGEHELWIFLEDFEGGTRNAYYSAFAIDDERRKYALKVLGNYSGTAGDSLGPLRGMKFSTRDVENEDSSAGDCAKKSAGGWWFKNCADSNLNGPYKRGAIDADEAGVSWKSWHGNAYSLKRVFMAIRPVKRDLDLDEL